MDIAENEEIIRSGCQIPIRVLGCLFKAVLVISHGQFFLPLILFFFQLIGGPGSFLLSHISAFIGQVICVGGFFDVIIAQLAGCGPGRIQLCIGNMLVVGHLPLLQLLLELEEVAVSRLLIRLDRGVLPFDHIADGLRVGQSLRVVILGSTCVTQIPGKEIVSGKGRGDSLIPFLISDPQDVFILYTTHLTFVDLIDKLLQAI